jgi:uncharacterized protein (TIGR03086 family)
MTGGVQLASALRYAMGAVTAVTPGLLPRPTPCRGWDLRMLLAHACDSVAAIDEGLSGGEVHLGAQSAIPADPKREFLTRAGQLLVRCDISEGRGLVLVGGCPMATGLLAVTGALEIAVHGWDVSQACGGCRPIPEALAGALLPAARALICDRDRATLFAPPQPVRAAASPSDRLAAFLGRTPAVHLAA